MSDDLGKKVQQIAQLLGQENVPDNLKELVSLFAASMSKKDEITGQEPDPAEEKDDVKPETEQTISFNPDMLDTARKAMEKLNASNDPRINLLNAIKPFMNSRRQKKIGNCIQLLKVASLSRMFNDQEK